MEILVAPENNQWLMLATTIINEKPQHPTIYDAITHARIIYMSICIVRHIIPPPLRYKCLSRRLQNGVIMETEVYLRFLLQ